MLRRALPSIVMLMLLGWPAAAQDLSTARAQVEAERFSEAEPALRAIVAGSDVEAGTEAARLLAEVLVRTDRADRALPLLRTALERQRALWGPEDPRVHSTELAVAERLVADGRFTEAGAFAAALAERAEQQSAPDHPTTLRAQAWRAQAMFSDPALREDSRQFEALDLMGQTFLLADAAEPRDPALRYDLMSVYAELMRQVGQTSFALPSVQEMLDILDERPDLAPPGAQRRLQARLATALLDERWVGDAVDRLRLSARYRKTAQAEARPVFAAQVHANWLWANDPDFGMAAAADRERYDPSIIARPWLE